MTVTHRARGHRTARAGLVLALALLAAALHPQAPASATGSATWIRTIGHSGHAGLYGWGAATANDGSVLIGDYWNFRIRHFSTSGGVIAPIIGDDRKGLGPGKHQAPYGIAVDPQTDDVYFGDVDGNATIDKYTIGGNYLGEWGGLGTGPGKFTYPAYVAVGWDRAVYVADARLNVIVKDDPWGRELLRWGTPGKYNGQLHAPRGIAVYRMPDGTDRVYVADSGNARVNIYTGLGNYVKSFGKPGTDLGDFGVGDNLRGLAIDKDNGWVYVVDGSNNAIDKFDLAGNFLLKWGTAGTGPGQFLDGGRSITVDGDHNVWVGDMPNYRAQVFSPTGAFLRQVPNPPQPPPPGGFASPSGVTVDKAGNIFVADTNNQRIEKFSPTGKFLTKWGSRGDSAYGFNYPRALADDPVTGAVYVADQDNGKVKKYSNTGQFLWQQGGLGSATGPLKAQGIAVARDGSRIYMALLNNTVRVLKSDGSPDSSFGSEGTGDGQFLFPKGIDVDPVDGSLWVCDAYRGDVQHFSATGAFLGKFGSLGTADTQLAKASDVAVSATEVFVSDSAKHKVKVWSKAGVFQYAFGGPGRDPGKMLGPWGLDFGPSRHLYVVEQTGERVQEFAVS